MEPTPTDSDWDKRLDLVWFLLFAHSGDTIKVDTDTLTTLPNQVGGVKQNSKL